MKLFTLNTHSWLEENQLDKLNTLAKKIYQEQYDIIALQEVNQLKDSKIIYDLHNFKPSNNQYDIKQDNFALYLINLLKDKYNTNYYWCWAYNHQGYDKYDEGVAILSKHPINKVNNFPFSIATDPLDYRTRVAIGIEVAINNRNYNFYSVHSSWWTSPTGDITFPFEAEKLLTLQQSNHPTFLMGDFNNPSQTRNEGYDLLTKDWFDTYNLAKKIDGKYTMGGKIAGWDQNAKPLRIDFILSSEQINVEKANILFDSRDTKPISDHFAYSIEIIT